MRNYKALAELATNRNLPSFAEFFTSQSQQVPERQIKQSIKRREKSKSAHYKWQAAFAERRLAAEKYLAAMGNQEAKRLIGLSEMERAAYGTHLLELIKKEIWELRTWNFSDLLDKFSDEARLVESLRSARGRLDKLKGHGNVSE